MDLFKSHRTVRKYKPVAIPKAILTDILESGIRASNTGNMQLYSIIVTSDDTMKSLLAPCHFNQAMVKEAPVILTICFDINRFNRWCENNNTSTELSNLLWLLNGVVDSSLLAQNIALAAEANGLGICYLGTTLYNASEISKILSLPNGVFPITALSVGYPEFIPELTDRLPLESVIHLEKYSDYSSDDICRIYKAKEELESSVKFVKENSKENLAQLYAEVRYKRADSEFFNSKLLLALKEQGFNI